MSKAFTRENDDAQDDDVEAEAVPVPGGRNYMTRAGYEAMRAELTHLLDVERPDVVKVVSWAASNGDRSENGDYLYGKRRLREIDRRIRFLTKRLDIAEVVDTTAHQGNDQVFFGARVTYLEPDGTERRVRIVGVDEIDPLRGRISWISPVARALIKARTGDQVPLNTPHGRWELEIIDVGYPADDAADEPDDAANGAGNASAA